MKTASREMNDEAMVSTPDLWPQWPILPLKHRYEREGGWPVVGFVLAIEPLVVYLGNMFAVVEGMASIEGLASKKFASAKELVAEWMVD